MAHYNLYESLGISRELSAGEIGAEIQRRLEANEVNNQGGADELNVAQKILGNENKRAQYDAVLDDPNSPEINIASLRRLADLGEPANNESHAPQNPQAPNATGPAPAAPGSGATAATSRVNIPAGFEQAMHNSNEAFKEFTSDIKSEYARSSRKAIIITAAVTAVVCLILGLGIRHFTNSDGIDRGAVSKAEDFAKISNAEEMEEWIDSVTSASDRSDWYSTFDITGSDDFEKPEVRYGIDNIGVVGAIDGVENMSSSFYVTSGSVRDAFEDADIDSATIVLLGDTKTDVAKISLTFLRHDGSLRFLGVDSLYELDMDEVLDEVS